MSLGSGMGVVPSLHQLLATHADAVVFDGQAFLVGVDQDRDAQRRVVSQQLGLRDRFVAQLFAGVGGIRDQFAEKDLFVGIDRVDDQVQQPGDIGIEGAAFLTVLIDDGHDGQIPWQMRVTALGIRRSG